MIWSQPKHWSPLAAPFFLCSRQATTWPVENWSGLQVYIEWADLPTADRSWNRMVSYGMLSFSKITDDVCISYIYIFYNYIYIIFHISPIYISHIQPIYKRCISHLSLGTPRRGWNHHQALEGWHTGGRVISPRQRLRSGNVWDVRFRGNPTKIAVGHCFSIVGKLGSDEVGKISDSKIVMNDELLFHTDEN